MNEYPFDPTEYMKAYTSTRRNFLRKRFANGIDVVRFYWFIGRVAAFPILGTWLIRPVLNLYSRYVDNNGMILPYEHIEQIITASGRLFVDPCDCRLEFRYCNAPLYTCLRIHLGAEIRCEETASGGISREEALAIARNAARHNLVFCLEQCIQPFDFNICMCCPCCCIVHRFKYELGHAAFFAGPYLPFFDEALCRGCGECAHHCRAEALDISGSKPRLDENRCLGCGICATHCQHGAIEMTFRPDRVRKQSEPDWVRMTAIYAFMYGYLFPMFLLFRLFAGSHRHKRELAAPNANDVPGHV